MGPSPVVVYGVHLLAIPYDASVVGQGCDDQFEFEFALDLMLDGLEELRGSA
jgi:hypothetical protein